MKTLVFESAVNELKNTYSSVEVLPEPFNKKTTVKKVLYGVKIQKPTAVRIYKYERSQRLIWVFGDIEINPDRFNVNEVAE